MVRTSSITVPSMVGLGLHMPPGAKKFNVFCLSGTVTLWGIAIKKFELRNGVDTVEMEAL